MISHLAIATGCAEDLEIMKLAACRDLQIAMDQAWESGEVGLPGEQLPLRIAA